MQPIFGSGPSLFLKLLFSWAISASLMLADTRLDSFYVFRYYLNTFISPVQYLSNMPRDIIESVITKLRTRSHLLSDNKALNDKLRLLTSDLLLLSQLKEDNQRLRELLSSPFVRDEKKMIANVMAVVQDPYKHQLMINKGRVDGVYEGQPVMHPDGVVGIISSVGKTSSYVTMLVDSGNAIPVQIVRNDIRIVASGTGEINKLELLNVPYSADIQLGDVLVTSGLGGVYPEGYPVGYIDFFSYDNKSPFAKITARPVVNFEKLRYLLLVWPTGANKEIIDREQLNMNQLESNYLQEYRLLNELSASISAPISATFLDVSASVSMADSTAISAVSQSQPGS